ncbi:MAG: C4-type zinc ribbon domain-containing protein [Bacteroidota bacterium]|nr:C4-type zinc ribbon domain-containing protein [Bacteroidota bacterium]
MAKATIKEKVDTSVEEKLKALFELQLIDSKIDRLQIIRGELPLEVQDLEDVVAGLETRFANFSEEAKEMEHQIAEKQNAIKDHKANIKKYEAQLGKVKNNREYDAITKEVEFQNLEIQLCEKRIKEFKAQIAAKEEFLTKAEDDLKDKKKDLKVKKSELDEIIEETQKEEQDLRSDSEKRSKVIEARLINAYKRIRSNSRNGLAVVPIERDACGGCFNKIPPQRQLDIKTHKKIIVCEHCGRVLVDPNIIPAEVA